MAYKYFTKRLLEKSDEIDLSAIVSDKQARAKERLNTNYGLPEIVDWIKVSTNNFRRTDNYFIDLDQAVQRLVYKYYESVGRANPFKGEVEEVEEVTAQPRVPTEVTTSGVKRGQPDVKVVKEETPTIYMPTKEEIMSLIKGYQIASKLDPDNPAYQELIDGWERYLKNM